MEARDGKLQRLAQKTGGLAGAAKDFNQKTKEATGNTKLGTRSVASVPKPGEKLTASQLHKQGEVKKTSQQGMPPTPAATLAPQFSSVEIKLNKVKKMQADLADLHQRLIDDPGNETLKKAYAKLKTETDTEAANLNISIPELGEMTAEEIAKDIPKLKTLQDDTQKAQEQARSFKQQQKPATRNPFKMFWNWFRSLFS